MPNNMLFFSTRNNGVDQSTPEASWRYGKGNVFSPTADYSETQNAAANIEAIKKDFQIDTDFPSILLQSQYENGIHEIDQAYLETAYQHSNQQDGPLIIKADGLFTQLTDIPLLNKSGDAHAIIFESPEAVGILVGSWRCLSKNIFKNMLDIFAKNNIQLEDITVNIGPGLGRDSYSIGKPTYQELATAFGDALEQAVRLKEDQTKYILDVHALINSYSINYGFKVDTSGSGNTFDKKAWKEAKAEAIKNKNPDILIKHYGEQPYFGARLYARTDRQIRRIVEDNHLETPDQLVNLSNNSDKRVVYSETGRCLNGVMRMGR